MGTIKHGKADTRLYETWRNMIARCCNPSKQGYKHYGEKGITVCADWHNLQSFWDWAIASGYDDTLTIDRIDNDKGYQPDNCRWITKQQQQVNKKDSRLITAFGKTQTLKNWTEDARCVVTRGGLNKRLASGMSPEEAITKPLFKPKEKPLPQPPIDKGRYLDAFGETKNVKQWSRDSRCCVCLSTFRARLRLGWTVEEALTLPATAANRWFRQ